MTFLTAFADLGLVLPLAGIIAFALLAVGRRRDAVAWSIGVAGTLATMLLLKLAVFVALGPEAQGALRNPSGHTASGTVVYAGLFVLLGRRPAPRVLMALVVGLGFGIVFGATRLALHVHTLADVMVGAAVGLAGTLALACIASPCRVGKPDRDTVMVTAVALLSLLALHGQTLHAEGEIESIAEQIRSASRTALPQAE